MLELEVGSEDDNQSPPLWLRKMLSLLGLWANAGTSPRHKRRRSLNRFSETELSEALEPVFGAYATLPPERYFARTARKTNAPAMST